MTDDIPSAGIHRTEDHRYYIDGDGPLPGVTTILKSFDKSDVLVGWAKKETAGLNETLTAFVDQVRADWRDEQMLNDEEAVIKDWQAVEADWQMRMGVSQ